MYSWTSIRIFLIAATLNINSGLPINTQGEVTYTFTDDDAKVSESICGVGSRK